VDGLVPAGRGRLILMYSQSTSGSSQPGERPVTRAFQFGQNKFRFDSIRFANLINLPLLHRYSISNDGEFGEGPGGVSLRCAISVSIRQFPTS